MKDKSYQGCPVGVVVAEYLRWKQMEVRAHLDMDDLAEALLLLGEKRAAETAERE